MKIVNIRDVKSLVALNSAWLSTHLFLVLLMEVFFFFFLSKELKS